MNKMTPERRISTKNVYSTHQSTNKLAKLMLLTFAILSGNAFAGTVAPNYDSSFWNASNKVYYNNCYNYATNKQTNTFAQPGRRYFGYNPINANTLNCSSIKTFSLLDGTGGSNDKITYYGSSKPTEEQCRVSSGRLNSAPIALVMAQNIDYHWYRQDSNTGGRWSHKRGQTHAKNVDENGVLITNPQTAERLIYTEFCGYFCTGSSSTNQGTGEANIN